MSQTLRRELRMKFLEVLSNHLDEVIIPEARADVMLDELADAALSTAGIQNSPAERKYNDPYWDLLHGGKVDGQAIDKAMIYTAIAERLERGLLRNEFPQTTEAQKIYQWIAEQEAKGESLDTWMKWAMEGQRANYSYVYHENPNRIKRDWPIAFVGLRPKQTGRRSERLSDD